MTELTHTDAPPSGRTSGGLSAPLLVGGLVLLSAGFQFAVALAGLFFATDEQIHAEEGTIAAIQGIGIVAAVALALAFGIAWWARQAPSRARVGAIVLGALAVLSLPVFWSGAPAIFGANAAWVGGLARGGTPQRGAGRAFAIVGLVVAILTVIADVVLTSGALVQRGFEPSA